MNYIERIRREVGRGIDPIRHNADEDRKLIQSYREGSEEAGMELMMSYLDVISIVYKYPSKPPYNDAKMKKLRYAPLTNDDKQDLFQEIMLQFFKLVNEEDLESGKPFEAFVRSRLHQRVFNEFFSEFLETRANEVEIDENMDFEAKDLSILLEDDTIKIPVKYLELYKAYNSLSKRERQVLEMSAVKGWTSVEVGEELGIDKVVARNYLKRAKKKVNDHFKEAGLC